MKKKKKEKSARGDDPAVWMLYFLILIHLWLVKGLPRGFPGGASGREFSCQCRRRKGWRFDPWVGKIPYSRKWHQLQSLPGRSHGQRSLAGYSPGSRKELDRTEQLNMHANPTQEFQTVPKIAITLDPWNTCGESVAQIQRTSSSIIMLHL